MLCSLVPESEQFEAADSSVGAVEPVPPSASGKYKLFLLVLRLIIDVAQVYYNCSLFFLTKHNCKIC